MKSIKSAAVKKVASVAKTKVTAVKENKLAASVIRDKKDPFNIHLVVPTGMGLDAKNVKVTVTGAQIVIEIQGQGDLVANQVEGVKKVPVPPRPTKPVEMLLNNLKFRFTMSKEAVR